jgi:hypothetical protein
MQSQYTFGFVALELRTEGGATFSLTEIERGHLNRPLRTSTANLGQASIPDRIKTSRHLLQGDDAFLVLMDDRDSREALKVLRTDADLMSTQTFVQWIAFKDQASANRLGQEEFDPGPAEDPTYPGRPAA